MDGSFRIGRIFGIPIQIHYTFLLVIPLFAWIIGSQISLTADMLKEIFQVPIDTTLITSGLHALPPRCHCRPRPLFRCARPRTRPFARCPAKGITINSITLMIFGGIATMEEGIPDPKVELPMALVGPITSLICRAYLRRARLCRSRRYYEPGGCRCTSSFSSAISASSTSSSVLQPDPGISHGRRPGAAGMAGKTDAAPPGHPDRGRYRQGFCHHLWDYRALFLLPVPDPDRPLHLYRGEHGVHGGEVQPPAAGRDRRRHDEQPGDHRAANLPVSQVITMMYSSKHLGFPGGRAGYADRHGHAR